MSAYLDGGWEQHSRHQPMRVWDSSERASRVFDAYQCATEYVLLTAGDRYDRVAGFAKRLRGARAPGRCSPRGSVRRHRAGRAELFGDNLEAVRALRRRSAAQRGGCSRRRLDSAYAPRRGAASPGRRIRRAGASGGALELAHVSPLAELLLFLVYGVLLEIPDEGAGALALIEACRDAIRAALGLPHFCPTGLSPGRRDRVRPRRPARARPRVPGARRARRG